MSLRSLGFYRWDLPRVTWAHLLSDSPLTSNPFTHSLHTSHSASTMFSVHARHTLPALLSTWNALPSDSYLTDLWHYPNEIIFQQNFNYWSPASFKFCSVLSLWNISCPSNLCAHPFSSSSTSSFLLASSNDYAVYLTIMLKCKHPKGRDISLLCFLLWPNPLGWYLAQSRVQ